MNSCKFHFSGFQLRSNEGGAELRRVNCLEISMVQSNYPSSKETHQHPAPTNDGVTAESTPTDEQIKGNLLLSSLFPFDGDFHAVRNGDRRRSEASICETWEASQPHRNA